MTRFMFFECSSAIDLNPVPLSLSPFSSGSEMVEAQCQRFEVRSTDGETVLFSADEEEITIGTEKLRVTGKHSVTRTVHNITKWCFIYLIQIVFPKMFPCGVLHHKCVCGLTYSSRLLLVIQNTVLSVVSHYPTNTLVPVNTNTCSIVQGRQFR